MEATVNTTYVCGGCGNVMYDIYLDSVNILRCNNTKCNSYRKLYQKPSIELKEIELKEVK